MLGFISSKLNHHKGKDSHEDRITYLDINDCSCNDAHNYLEEQVYTFSKAPSSKMLIYMPTGFNLTRSDEFYMCFDCMTTLAHKGLRYLAVVGQDIDVMNRLFIENLKGSTAQDRIDILLFHHSSDAVRWLEKQRR